MRPVRDTGSVNSPGDATYEFDVALSFAGEDRAFVQEVASALKERGLRPFYDEDFATQMWGEDLYDYLDDVYRQRARFTVIFVSRHYVAKPWTNHERQSAQARALESATVYVLPVRLDDADLPGLRSTVSYLDGRSLTPSDLASAIADKCAGSTASAASDDIFDRVPRTEHERRSLLGTRPFAWEYFLFAATLFDGARRLEVKYRDHEVRFAPRTSQVVSGSDVFGFVSAKASELSMITRRINALLSPDVQARAFGGSGQPGDVDRIVHLASRIVSIYEDLMDWASDVRGTVVHQDARELVDLVAEMADRPVCEVRRFIDDCVRETDALRARFEREESVELVLRLIITSDDEVSRRLDKALSRARRRLR